MADAEPKVSNRPRCPECKMHVRGPNHEEGYHHQNKVGVKGDKKKK